MCASAIYLYTSIWKHLLAHKEIEFAAAARAPSIFPRIISAFIFSSEFYVYDVSLFLEMKLNTLARSPIRPNRVFVRFCIVSHFEKLFFDSAAVYRHAECVCDTEWDRK